MAELRLGDIIDDYCPKCRLLTNHSVAALVNGDPAKTQCRTCYHEHNYRHAKVSTKKKPNRKAELFDEVLGKMTGEPSFDDSSSKPNRK